MIDIKTLNRIAEGDFDIEDFDPKTGADVCILIDNKPIELPLLEDWHIIQAGEKERHLHADWGIEEKIYVAEVGLRSFEDWFVFSLHGKDKEAVMRTAIKIYALEMLDKAKKGSLEVISLSFKPAA